TRSEAAGAEATFELVNRYLETIEPAIHEHEGFINKFLGDGILALFPDAAAGLAGARSLQRAVVDLNQQLEKEGQEPIRVGVGLHVGTVMLGTVGGKKQLDTSVIADAVNTASRVESLTKRYGVDILATTTALEEAGSTDGSRELDRVVVVGRQEPITVHEVYWQETDHAERDRAYADALKAYRQGQLEEALVIFQALAESDPTARRMASETEKLIERGLPSSWSGVVRLDEK
ncbi:MAG: hypothetical protein JRI23_35040, partial [Deltaproteobacteria bacterium]|nr:hypothetical protein [Deltaproteobacteria bacterium]MBW2537524.1 hypothetical protein [Deltaproteobacteria bacterium]